MKKIQITSHLLALFFRLLCFLIPLATTYLLFFNLQAMLSWGFFDHIISPGKVQHPEQFSTAHRFILLGISSLPMSISVFICHKLSQLFKRFEQGELFEEAHVKLVKQIGLCMISSELIQLIYQPLITAALTFSNGPGERIASITLGKANGTTIITALILLVVSWIIKEAQQLKVESQLTI
ncbi:DUF2975 domain-containing protein [Legionella jordanis]|uniref:DUF2975 domain-containing protein n=1 Tax=Legionella jordanis TaxID=456 RepID=A0A0W0VGF4_9GAMM|nr:DUF2975 domain-containing protein [Legionella jordanis]KTD19235.1 hypothetical protein Ljor_0032 [Legionella jordanis]RMW99829.1 DUF2975 domain-containing protein [Legionella jordanis]VEH12879.1 Protein of uncharacterised function (DUF2975) [Legionella jordanis]HAT8714867.1 DUF2975 domain-containing protein [Legionella jordanis]